MPATPTATDRLLEIIRELAESNDTFTSDDIRPLLPPGATPRQIPAAVGKARRHGLVEEVGRVRSVVPERKNSLIPVLRAARTEPLPSGGDTEGSGPVAPVSPQAEAELRALRDHLESRGHLVGLVELAALLLMAATRPWLVLAGPPGTGKSSAIRLLTEALGGELHDLQVKPNWTSSDDVLGYYSETTGRFLPGPLLRALTAAEAEPDRLHVARFDEMNLASPEHYLAEVLSAGEHWSAPDADGVRRSAPITLPPLPDDRVPAAPRLPGNLLLVGTLNADETTRVLSPKVLDRAAVFDLHHVDLYGVPTDLTDPTDRAAGSPQAPPPALPLLRAMLLRRPRTLADARAHLDGDAVEAVGDLLSRLEPHLRRLGAPLGYRQRDALLLGLAGWRAHGLGGVLSSEAVLDVALRSAVLPGLQGATPGAVAALRGVAGALLDADVLPAEADVDHLRDLAVRSRYPRSVSRVLDMLEQGETLGWFSAW